MAALASDEPAPLAAAASRRAVDEARAAVLEGAPAPSFEAVVASARAHLEAGFRTMLTPVINATGVLVHTNLGRVPLGEAQLDAVLEAAGGYSNLELDLASGRRGSRHAHAASLLRTLTGAEAAIVVNNNAAAVLDALAALCAGREVIISRGELIEIGGQFRIPDVMASSGARLVEVGTTNRTHLRDYEAALSADTAAILKVHPSNYKVVGFTAEVPARDLARLARGRGVPLLYDLGSGLLEHRGGWTAGEPSVAAALEDGADVVMFSGDKLLGGPQAGILLGRSSMIAKIGLHPLMRAVRPDKMTLAALQATLIAYLRGEDPDLPLWRMADASSDELRERAERLARAIAGGVGGVKAEAVPSQAVTGGGSLPGAEIASWAVAVSHPARGAEEIDAALRCGRPPVVGRIADDVMVLDMRTVLPAQDEALAGGVVAALNHGA